MRLYLSGPMTGLPDFNYPLFNQVAKDLRALGINVVNPAENFGGRVDLPREEYMRKDVALLLMVDGVALLPGWRHSVGARLEVAIAQQLGLPFFEAHKLSWSGTWGIQSAEPDRVVTVLGL